MGLCWPCFRRTCDWTRSEGRIEKEMVKCTHEALGLLNGHRQWSVEDSIGNRRQVGRFTHRLPWAGPRLTPKRHISRTQRTPGPSCTIRQSHGHHMRTGAFLASNDQEQERAVAIGETFPKGRIGQQFGGQIKMSSGYALRATYADRAARIPGLALRLPLQSHSTRGRFGR